MSRPSIGSPSSDPGRSPPSGRYSCMTLPGSSSQSRSSARPCSAASARSVARATSGRAGSTCSEVISASRPKSALKRPGSPGSTGSALANGQPSGARTSSSPSTSVGMATVIEVRGPGRKVESRLVGLGRRPMIQAAPTGARCPFDTSGVERGPDGVLRYTDRPASVVALLRASVERDPGAPAIVDLEGPRLSYQELWDRGARVAGGLRAAGVGPGDRVAVRLLNGADWVLGFFGTLMAGGVVVPVNTRFAEEEVAYV